GRPDLAQAGGKEPAKLDAALGGVDDAVARPGAEAHTRGVSTRQVSDAPPARQRAPPRGRRPGRRGVLTPRWPPVAPRRRFLLLLLVGLGLIVGACAGVGGPVPGAPAHHREHGFANENPAFGRPPLWARTRFFVARILASIFAPRTITLPRVANDGAVLRANHAEPTITWIGHATLLIQLDGVNVLTDPQWSNRASPVSFAGPRRVTPPRLRFEDPPPPHGVLISHPP